MDKDLLPSLQAQHAAARRLTGEVLTRYAAGEKELGILLTHLEEATRQLERARESYPE